MPIFNVQRSNNKESEIYLQFLYDTTPDWKSFFDILYKEENKCKLILPWYKSAIARILGSNNFFEEAWIIDLYKIPKDDFDSYIPDIEFTGKKISGGSRLNITNKKGHYKKIINKHMSLKDQLYNMKFTKKEIQRLIDITNKLNGTNIKYIPHKNLTCKNKKDKKTIDKKAINKNIYYDDSLYSCYFEELYNMKFTEKELDSLRPTLI